jgi:hypothetical protein
MRSLLLGGIFIGMDAFQIRLDISQSFARCCDSVGFAPTLCHENAFMTTSLTIQST